MPIALSFGVYMMDGCNFLAYMFAVFSTMGMYCLYSKKSELLQRNVPAQGVILLEDEPGAYSKGTLRASTPLLPQRQTPVPRPPLCFSAAPITRPLATSLLSSGDFQTGKTILDNSREMKAAKVNQIRENVF